jgi:hypothetical protein
MVEMTTLTGGFTKSGFDASSILDGDEAGATGATQEHLALNLVFDSAGNIVLGANGSYMLASQSNCSFSATAIAEQDVDIDGFNDIGAASLVSISGKKGGAVTFTYDFGTGAFGTFTGTLSADGQTLTGTVNISDNLVSTTSSITLGGDSSAEFANNLKTFLQNAGINTGPGLLQNLPEVMYGIQSTMRTMGLTWAEMGPIIRSAAARNVLGNVIGPAIGVYMASSQYQTDLANKNPSIWINAATNVEKVLIGVGAIAVTIDAAPVLTPLGSLALGLTIGAVQTLADSWLTTQLNSLNANFISLATPSDFGSGSSPIFTSSTAPVFGLAASATQTAPQKFDPGYYLSNHPDAVQAVASGVYRSALAYFLGVGLARGDLPYAGAAPVNPSSIPDAAAQAAAINSASTYFGVFDLPLGSLHSDGVSNIEKAVGKAVFSGPAAVSTTVSLDKTLTAVANRYAFDLARNQNLSGSVGDYFGGTPPNLSNGATLATLEAAGASGFNNFSVYVHSALPGESFANIVSGLQQDFASSPPSGTQAYGIADVSGIWVVMLANTNSGTTITSPSVETISGDDFTGFGTSDALWRNASTGAWGWTDFANNDSWHDLGPSLTSFTIVGTGDFNGDGSADALWRENSTGHWGWSDIHNNTAWHDLGPSLTSFTIVGTGDFNGDGSADALWRENSTGHWGWSDVQNNLAWHDLGGSLTAYRVVGVGDFNADGSSDVLWRNDTTGAWGWSDIKNNMWHDLGGSLTAYHVVGVGDFNADGSSDVLWRNDTTGAWGWSDIHNNAWHNLGGSSTDYVVAAIGDYNGDNYSDVLWRNNNSVAWGWSDIHNNAWHDLGGSLTSYKVVA